MISPNPIHIPSFVPFGKIITINGNTVSAQDNAHTQTIQFAASLSAGSHFVARQPVWVNLSTKQTMVVTFPILGTRRDDLGHSYYMETSITVSDTGRLDAKTKIWTTEALRGFSGGVVVTLKDDHGNILNSPQIRSFGVNGTSMPGAPSDRTELWNELVPVETILQTRSFSIVHLRHESGNHLEDFLHKANEVATLAKTVTEAYQNVAGSGGAAPGGGGGAPGGGGAVAP